MECRKLEITLVSAQIQEKVRQLFKKRLRVYAKVSLGGNPRTEKTTPVGKEGQTNPAWNFTADFTIGKKSVTSQDIKLLIQFFCEGNSRPDTDIGEVSVSLKELYDHFLTRPRGGTAKMSYPVKKGGKDLQGEVSCSYKFGDVFALAPPSTDWGKLCWEGTKLVAKGGVLFARLALLAHGNIFDVPIDAAIDVVYTSYDLVSNVFGGGADLLTDIPWGEPDLLVGSSCPAGADVPCTAVDTNAPAGSNVLTDGFSIPNTEIQAPTNVTCETNMSAHEVSCSGEDVPMTTSCQVPAYASAVVDANISGEAKVTDNTSCLQADFDVDATFNGEINVFDDISCIEGDARVEATFSGEMNATSDVSLVGADHIQVNATFGGEMNVTSDISLLGADIQVDATFSGEMNATSDVSLLGADHIQVDATFGEEMNVTTFGEEMNVTSDISFLGADIQVDATFSGEVNVAGDISLLGADIGVDSTFISEVDVSGDISCLEADVKVDASFSGEVNMSCNVSCLEVDVQVDASFNGEATWLGEDVEVDVSCSGDANLSSGVSCLEANVQVDTTFNGKINRSGDVSYFKADDEEDAETNVSADISSSNAHVRMNASDDCGEMNVTNDISHLEVDVKQMNMAGDYILLCDLDGKVYLTPRSISYSELMLHFFEW